MTSLNVNIANTITGCPKKLATLFVKAIIFRPRIVKGWCYIHFAAHPSTHTLHMSLEPELQPNFFGNLERKMHKILKNYELSDNREIE